MSVKRKENTESAVVDTNCAEVESQVSMSRIVLGNVLLLQNDWLITFQCTSCCMEFENSKKFLQHSLQHYFKPSEIEKDFMNRKIGQEESDDDDYSETNCAYIERAASDDEIVWDTDNCGKSDINLEFEKIICLGTNQSISCDIRNFQNNKSTIFDEVHKGVEAFQNLDYAEVDETTIKSSIDTDELMKQSERLATNDEKLRQNQADQSHIQLPKDKPRKVEIEIQRRNVASLPCFIQAKESFELSKPKMLKSNQLNCQVCQKRYYSVKAFKSHVKRHSAVFECDMCEAAFNDACNLKEHRNRHLGRKPHKCTICTKTFTTTTELKVHMRMHTGEKPYVCDQCGASYKTSSHLTLHYRKHTNSRPHKCDLCEKAFFKKYDLSVHKRVHSKERPYECTVCGQRFGRYDSLKQHGNLHLASKNYKCDQCDKSFAQNAGLYAHLKNYHGLVKLNSAQ